MSKWRDDRSRSSGRPLGDYALVAERIVLFYERYPSGRILTELVGRDDVPQPRSIGESSHRIREITFRALVYRSPDESQPAATGWASEREGDGEINTVACLENAETSAVGRALANLGFTASPLRASREEMEKADRERARRQTRAPSKCSRSGASHERSVRTEFPPPVPRVIPVVQHIANIDADPLQQSANALHDLLDLINRAAALGFPARRDSTLRQALLRGAATPERIGRLERRLRGWLARHRDPS